MTMIIEGLAKTFGELTLYQGYAQQMSAGKLPYIDFIPEYPIGALALFNLANIAGEKWFTLIWYVMIASAALGIALLINKMKGNPYIFLAAVLPLGGLFWDRFDIFATLFSILALWRARKGDYISTALWLFCGTIIKIYPIILLPIVILIIGVNAGWHKAVYSIGIFSALMVILVATQIPMINALSKYHGHRGIQVESVKAMPLLIKPNSVVEWAHGTYEIKAGEKQHDKR